MPFECDQGRENQACHRVDRRRGSKADVSDQSTGSAGNIVLNIGESFEMSNRNGGTAIVYRDLPGYWRGGLISRATGTCSAGSILLNAPQVVFDDARVLTTVRGAGHIDPGPAEPATEPVQQPPQ